MFIFLSIFMYAVWSTVFPLGKIALGSAPPLFLTGFRMLFAAAILLGWLAIKDRQMLKLGKKQILPLMALAIFSIYVTNILEFWGLQRLSAAKTCFIYSLSPFFAAIFSYIHFGEKVNLQKILGMVIGLIGFMLGLYLSKGPKEMFSVVGIFSWPELSIVGAALVSVYGWVLLRVLVKNQMVSPLYANGYSMLLGGALALLHSFFVDSYHPLPISNGQGVVFLRSVTLMVLISNVLCYNLYGFLLKRFTATFLSFVGLISPFFTSLSGWILLKEPPSWIIFISMGIVSLGLFLVYRAELKQGYILGRRKLSTPFR